MIFIHLNEIDAKNFIEVWAYAASISTHEFEPDDLSPQGIRDMFGQLKNEIIGLKEDER